MKTFIYCGGTTIAVALLNCAGQARAAEGSEAKQPDHSDQRTSEAASSTSQDVDDIFRSVFGKERPALGQGSFSVLVDGINVGEFLIKPGDKNTIGAVESKFVKNILIKTLEDEVANKVSALTNGRDYIPFEMLSSFGIKAQFDETALVLRVEIPIELASVRELNLRGLRKQADLNYTEQADFSAAASFRAGATLIEDSASFKSGIYRFATDIDLAVNLKGVVATAVLRYDDLRARKFTRGDIRLTYDDRNSLIRYEVGDLSVGRRPFQNAPRIAGVSAFRNFSINPYMNIRPTPELAFDLERPARVEIYVNGAPVRSFDLRSGRYNLRDFPVVASAGNDIELQINYGSGQIEVRRFPAFYDLELLAPGLTDFAINFGLPYRDDNGVRRYDDNDYNGTAYVRHGLTPTLTVGGNWEGNRRFDLAGGELVWASPIGTFGVNGSTNLRKPSVASSQLTLQYRWRGADLAKERSIDALISLTGKEYQTLNQIFSGSFVAEQARIRAGQKFGKYVRAQVFAGYERYRGAARDSYYVGVNVSRQFRFGSVSAGVEYRRNEERSGPSFRLAFTMPLGRSNVTGSYMSEDNAARIEYSQLGAVGANSFGFSAGADRRDGSDRQFARASYIGNRFEASVQQIARNYFSDSSQRDMRTELNFGSAVVMADGLFAISPPVRNSFAIFKVDERAGDHRIAVEPRTGFGSSQKRYSGYSGSLGPAVITSLTPYFSRSVQVDAPDAPPGTSIGGQVFELRPGFRSGYGLKIGSAANVSIIGNMQDKDGDPLAFVSGELRMNGGDGKTLQLFTNATGRFFVDGIEAGKEYTAKVTIGENQVEKSLKIPADASGMYKVGEYVFFDVDVESEEKGDDQK